MQELLTQASVWFVKLDIWFTAHRLVAVLAILLAASIVAFLVDKLISGVVKVAVSRTRTTLDDRLVGYLHRPLFMTVFLIGIGLAVRYGDVRGALLKHSDSVLWTIGLLIWLVFSIRAARLVLQTMARSAKQGALVRLQTLPLFEYATVVVLILLAAWVFFLIWNIDMTAWLASAGIAGIVIGLAAKDTMANLFAGVFIMADSPYSIGDYIVLESGERGEVSHIGLRTTRIFTKDHTEVSIPNAVIGNSLVVNESGGEHEKSRVRVAISVAYGSDLEEVEALFMRVAAEEPLICAAPPPTVRVRLFGPSGIDYELLCWVDKPTDRGRAVHQLYRKVYTEFRAQGIEIPFAKQDIYVKELPAS